MNCIFLKKSGLINQKLDDDILIMKEDSCGEAIYLSEVSNRIFELCDGRNTVSDIIEILCSEYEVEKSICEQDVERCIQELLDAKLLDKREASVQ